MRSISTLHDAISSHAAIRRIRRLQPAGGAGDKIFPPTYPGEQRGDPPRHVFERRRNDDKEVWCVLIDSVQSQANRLEEALLSAATDGDALPLPYVSVDFSAADLHPLERITSLEAPHRVYDAILRDSFLDGVPFMQSEQGRRLAAAKPADATALLELSPTALIFGAWHSQGEGGGLGAKFPRALVSEIIGVDAPVEVEMDPRARTSEPRNAGRRTGSRIDPLGVLRKVEVFKGPSGWSTEQGGAGKGAKKVRPSEIQPQQYRTVHSASWRHVRLCRAPGSDHSGRTETAAVRGWRSRYRRTCAARRARSGSALRTGCVRLRVALPLRPCVRWSRPAGDRARRRYYGNDRVGPGGSAGAVSRSIPERREGGLRLPVAHADSTAQAGRNRPAQPRAGARRRRPR